MRVDWQQNLKGNRIGSCHFSWIPWLIKLELWQKPAPDLEGRNHKETHEDKCKISVTERHFFLFNLSMTSLFVFVLHSSYLRCFNVFLWGSRRLCKVFPGACFFIFYSPCTEKVVFYLSTCCLNCPVQCVQPPSPPHCDYFICTFCWRSCSPAQQHSVLSWASNVTLEYISGTLLTE